MKAKEEIRRETLLRRDSMPQEERQKKSRLITARLTGLAALESARTVMTYLGFGSEVGTDDLVRWGLARGKQIVVPLCRGQGRRMVACRIDSLAEVAPGLYGIREPREGFVRPVDPRQIDVVIVPGVAFDRRGHRVGYGGGFYDRFLGGARQAFRIGVAFSCQIVPEIPAQDWDLRVHCLVTEKGIMQTDCADFS